MMKRTEKLIKNQIYISLGTRLIEHKKKILFFEIEFLKVSIIIKVGLG